ncbi:MAG: ChbG/HpnK family deacetylase [Gemmatimonadaceae bacterium]|nr:ChbG/HpnK family deacetylase [Gemmatimonadaceae bacterium]
MPRPYWPSLVLFLLASPLAAQTRTVAERLGYPSDAKLLILHADDLGVAHSENVASFAALDSGTVSSASIMMPTPWVTEVAAYAKAHPGADLGLHLTLTAEWATYKWGSVASRDSVRSLLDSTGVFPADVPPVVARAKLADVERELRAQINRARALGIEPTHVDSHMGTLFATPALLATYVKVAHAFGLPFLAVKGMPGLDRAKLTARDIVIDTVVMAGDDVPRARWKQFYLDALTKLKPGVSEMIVHLGHDDAELQAVTVDHEPYGSAWRQRDYEVVTSPEFRQALRDNHIILIGYKDLRKAALAR